MDLDTRKPVFGGFGSNTGAVQPAHQGGLISAFVIRFLKRIKVKLATGEISIFYLVSVAEETGLKLAMSETPKTGFVAVEAQLSYCPLYYEICFFFIRKSLNFTFCGCI